MSHEIKTAYRELNRRHRILAPANEAWVTYPDFDPCKASQIVATIHWPAMVNCREVILTHHISDGDPI